MFKYNPKNHCWPAVRKAVTVITLATLLLSLIEAQLTNATKEAFEISNGIYFIIAGIFGLFNSIILRRYVCVISLHNSRNPRFGTHLFIIILTFFYFIVGKDSISDIHGVICYSKKINKQVIQEVDFTDWFYIDNPGVIDTIGYGLATEYWEEKKKHCFRGYYVMPFHENNSVFYGVELGAEYPTKEYSKSYSEKRFKREFHESIKQHIKSNINNHLFKRTTLYDSCCFQAAIQNSLSKRNINQGTENNGDFILLTPIKYDHMTYWENFAILHAFIFIYSILIFLIVFACSKTQDFPDKDPFAENHYLRKIK